MLRSRDSDLEKEREKIDTCEVRKEKGRGVALSAFPGFTLRPLHHIVPLSRINGSFEYNDDAKERLNFRTDEDSTRYRLISSQIAARRSSRACARNSTDSRLPFTKARTKAKARPTPRSSKS